MLGVRIYRTPNIMNMNKDISFINNLIDREIEYTSNSEWKKAFAHIARKINEFYRNTNNSNSCQVTSKVVK